MSSAWPSLLVQSMSVVLQGFFSATSVPSGSRGTGRGGSLFFSFCMFLFFLLVERGGIECWQRKKNKVRRVETQFPLLDWTFYITRHSCLTLQPRQEFATPTTTHHHDLTVIPGLIPQVTHLEMPTNPLHLAPGATPSKSRREAARFPFRECRAVDESTSLTLCSSHRSSSSEVCTN